MRAGSLQVCTSSSASSSSSAKALWRWCTRPGSNRLAAEEGAPEAEPGIDGTYLLPLLPGVYVTTQCMSVAVGKSCHSQHTVPIMLLHANKQQLPRVLAKPCETIPQPPEQSTSRQHALPPCSCWLLFVAVAAAPARTSGVMRSAARCHHTTPDECLHAAIASRVITLE